VSLFDLLIVKPNFASKHRLNLVLKYQIKSFYLVLTLQEELVSLSFPLLSQRIAVLFKLLWLKILQECWRMNRSLSFRASSLPPLLLFCWTLPWIDFSLWSWDLFGREVIKNALSFDLRLLFCLWERLLFAPHACSFLLKRRDELWRSWSCLLACFSGDRACVSLCFFLMFCLLLYLLRVSPRKVRLVSLDDLLASSLFLLFYQILNVNSPKFRVDRRPDNFYKVKNIRIVVFHVFAFARFINN